MNKTLLFVLAAAGCSAVSENNTDTQKDPIAELDAPGTYNVGFRTISLEYDAPLQAEKRKIDVLVWYPAHAAEGSRPVYLLRKSEVAIKDAPPLADVARSPIVFSHGHSGYAAEMSYLMEHFASHGYVAIAPTHAGNTLLDGGRQTDIYYLRGHDVRAALDRLQSDASIAGPLKEQALMVGHSFGGYTSFTVTGASFDVDALHAACEKKSSHVDVCSTLTPEKEEIFRQGLADPRFVGAATFDAGDSDLFGADGIAAIHVPVLQMVSERGGSIESDLYWQNFTVAATRVYLRGATHNDFVDACAEGVGPDCSGLSVEPFWRSVRVYSLDLARTVLDGKSTALGEVSGVAELNTKGR